MNLDDVVKEGDAMREVAKTWGAPQLSASDIEALSRIGKPRLGIARRLFLALGRLFSRKRPGRHRIKPRPVWFNPEA